MGLVPYNAISLEVCMCVCICMCALFALKAIQMLLLFYLHLLSMQLLIGMIVVLKHHEHLPSDKHFSMQSEIILPRCMLL